MVRAKSHTSPSIPPPPSHYCGFTLIEMLVTISVVAVLLSLSLPVLGGARQRAQVLSFQINQRECANMIFVYANDSDNYFPGYGLEGTMIAPLEWNGGLVDATWWGQIEYWGVYLQTRGYDGWVSLGPNANASSFNRIDCTACGHARAIHLLMAGAFADPEFFLHGAEDDSVFHQIQRLSSVKSTARKGLLLHLRSLSAPLTVISFNDGHGEMLSSTAMAPGADVDIPFAPLPVVCTVNGVRGRDR